MKIRELKNTELDLLLALYKDLHDEDEPVSAEAAEHTWREIQANPRLKYFGAFEGDSLLSCCTIAVIPNLTRACRPYGLIENVVTRMDRRRQGLGKKLLQQVLDYAWSQDCYKVMLMTGRLDENTFRFYEAAGFDRSAKQGFVAKPGDQ